MHFNDNNDHLREWAVPGPTWPIKSPMNIDGKRFWTNEHPRSRSLRGINDLGGHANGAEHYHTHICALPHPVLACHYERGLSFPIRHTDMTNPCLCVKESHQVKEHLSAPWSENEAEICFSYTARILLLAFTQTCMHANTHTESGNLFVSHVWRHAVLLCRP